MSGISATISKARTLDARQNLRTFRRDGNGVFKMRRRTTIQSNDRPTVFEHPHLFSSQIDHRFDRNDEARLNLRSFATLNIVQYRRIFMKRSPDAMSAEFP